MNEFIFRDKNDYSSILLNNNYNRLQMNPEIDTLFSCMIDYVSLLSNEEYNQCLSYINEQRTLKIKEQTQLKIQQILHEAQTKLNELDPTIVLTITTNTTEVKTEPILAEDTNEDTAEVKTEPLLDEDSNEDTDEEHRELTNEEVKNFLNEQYVLYQQLKTIQIDNMDILNHIENENTKQKYLSMFKNHFINTDGIYTLNITSIKSLYQLNTILAVITKLTNIKFDKKMYESIQSIAHNITKNKHKKKTNELMKNDVIKTIINKYNELVKKHLEDGNSIIPYIKNGKSKNNNIFIIMFIQYILFNYGVRNNQLIKMYKNPTTEQCGWTDEYIQLTNDKNNDDIRYIYLDRDEILKRIVESFQVDRIEISNPSSFKRDFITFTCNKLMDSDMTHITPTDFRRFHCGVDIQNI